jgi:hypothetical protein
MDNLYIVAERPNLQTFLDYIFKHFHVSVWTAATEEYGWFIIKNVILKPDKNRKIVSYMSEKHCNYSYKKTNAIKSLSLLWEDKDNNFNKNNTVILDDNLEVYNAQTKNCIRAVPFYFLKYDNRKKQHKVNTDYDDFLLTVIQVIEKLRAKNKPLTASRIACSINKNSLKCNKFQEQE